MRKTLFTGLVALAAFAASVLMLRLLRSPGTSVVVRSEGVRSQRSLDDMTRDELYELARERNVSGRSKMNKSELRAALDS